MRNESTVRPHLNEMEWTKAASPGVQPQDPLLSPSPSRHSQIIENDEHMRDKTEKVSPHEIRTIRNRQRNRFGWWWEITAALLTVACTVLIMVILFSMDGKPLARWRYRFIQPNSLVAIFSTLAKSSLLFPIAECLGQLKWSYFEKPRPISHLQRFDSASRGPWGAVLLLWEVKGRAIVASLGAVVTVMLLVFEPFAQQV